ncbi:MAG: hypothetical protein JW940_05985 [Polyangiaceae bacterium]|nr:hypothetical protein [Polyangiaceae bacterium]
MFPDSLPCHHDLVEAPERAHLAMLRTAAVLASRALVLEHGDLGDDLPCASTDRPTLLIATLLLRRLDELAQLLDWYEQALQQLLAYRQEVCSDLPF